MSWRLYKRVKSVIDALSYTQVFATTTAITEDTSTGTPKVIDCASSGTANTFGSWVEFDASTASSLRIGSFTVQTADTTAKTCTVEVGTGAQAGEVTLIRVSFGSGAAAIQPFVYPVLPPRTIAESTRIAIRASDSEAAANTYSIGIQYV